MYKELVEILIKQEYEEVQLKEIDFSIYMNHRNIIGVKVYDNWVTLTKKWEADQFGLYDYLIKSNRYNNNVYFFMLLTQPLGNNKLEVAMKLNKIEKNEYILRKYILIGIEDMKRIPILFPVKFESVSYEDDLEKFKNMMVEKLSNDGEEEKRKVIIGQLEKYLLKWRGDDED